jgi:hypothetical protein
MRLKELKNGRLAMVGRAGGREGGRAGGLEGGRERVREGGREEGREKGREGGREEGRKGGREGGREGEREGGRQGGRAARRRKKERQFSPPPITLERGLVPLTRMVMIFIQHLKHFPPPPLPPSLPPSLPQIAMAAFASEKLIPGSVPLLHSAFPTLPI